MITKNFYVLGGGGLAAVTAVTVALTTGFNPFAPKAPEPQQQALAIPQSTAVPEAAEKPAVLPDPAKPAEPAKPETANPADPVVVAPVFGIVRVEPDGSVVVAGTAAPNATVELLTGTRNLGSVKAGENGDFAIVLDEPLKPGDYQLVLRATEPSGTVATSLETAVVAVPETPGGQVLALVERPGEPSRLITKPEPAPAAAQPQSQSAVTPAGEPAAKAPVEKPADAATMSPAAQPAPAVAEPAAKPVETAAVAPAAESGKQDKPSMAEPAAPAARVLVEAVEIEGRDVFVAGTAAPGSRVRVYANDMLLGEALTSAEGRFLVEATRDLAVGDYIIRADQLDTTGATVLARAQVPFQREAGEKVAAVAPEVAPAATSAPASDPSGKPAEPAAVAGQAAPLQSAEGSVIIRKGDTLWQLSRRVYGRGVRYSTIYLANQQQITDPNRIWPGQVFKVPGKTPEGEAADMSTVEAGTQADNATR